MTVKNIEWTTGDSEIAETDIFGPDDLDELQSELEEETNAIWPCAEFLDEALPPAPGRSRRVPHDW